MLIDHRHLGDAQRRAEERGVLVGAPMSSMSLITDLTPAGVCLTLEQTPRDAERERESVL